MSVSPVALVIGLSGAGKTQACEWMVHEGFLHLDGDVRDQNGIDLLGIRSEWNQFWNGGNPQNLAAVLRERAEEAKAAGALLSLPSTALFTSDRLTSARDVDLRTIMLFGPPADCIRAFLKREQKMRKPMSEADWHSNNDHVYDRYVDPVFDIVRLNAFKPDHSRWSREELVNILKARLA